MKIMDSVCVCVCVCMHACVGGCDKPQNMHTCIVHIIGAIDTVLNALTKLTSLIIKCFINLLYSLGSNFKLNMCSLFNIRNSFGNIM